MNLRWFSTIGQAFRKWKNKPAQIVHFPNSKNEAIDLPQPPSKIFHARSCIRKSKEGTVYLSKELRAMLEKFREPHKSITTAIDKVLDIVRRNRILIVVVQGRKIHCNMMKKIHQRNRVFCKMLQTMVSPDYCKEKCLAAPIVREVLEKSKSDNEAEIVPLEKFLPSKIEHLRNPPKIEKDHFSFNRKMGIYTTKPWFRHITLCRNRRFVILQTTCLYLILLLRRLMETPDSLFWRCV